MPLNPPANNKRMSDNNTHNCAPIPASGSGSGRMLFGNIEVDGLNVQACMGVFIVTMIILAGVLGFRGNGSSTDFLTDYTSHFTVSSGEEMIDLLKENELWEIDDGAVSPLIFASYPGNINQFNTDVKKKLFFHSLLPVALVALEEVRDEKMALHDILARFPDGYTDLVFSDDYGVWGRVLTSDEIEYILMLTRKYRANRAVELARRVDLVPLSMILAQAAIESSWGTSRFAREGNNLFGIWTWGEKGLVPEGRDDGKNHKVAIYDSILDSVRVYILTLNRLPAYSKFRQIRRQTMNPLKLVDGLLFYSQRREQYVWEVKDLIQYNKLNQYDSCYLAERPVQHKSGRVFRFTQRTRKDAA
jgi:Bax protein